MSLEAITTNAAIVLQRNYHSLLRNSSEEHSSLLTYSVYLSEQQAVTKY